MADIDSKVAKLIKEEYRPDYIPTMSCTQSITTTTTTTTSAATVTTTQVTHAMPGLGMSQLPQLMLRGPLQQMEVQYHLRVSHMMSSPLMSAAESTVIRPVFAGLPRTVEGIPVLPADEPVEISSVEEVGRSEVAEESDSGTFYSDSSWTQTASETEQLCRGKQQPSVTEVGNTNPPRIEPCYAKEKRMLRMRLRQLRAAERAAQYNVENLDRQRRVITETPRVPQPPPPRRNNQKEVEGKSAIAESKKRRNKSKKNKKADVRAKVTAADHANKKANAKPADLTMEQLIQCLQNMCGKRQSANPKQSNKPSATRPQGRGDLIPPGCFACGDLSHKIAYCPSKQCYACHRYGHFANQCPQRAATPAPEKRPDIHCFGCGESGVLLYNCPNCSMLWKAMGNAMSEASGPQT